MNAVGQPISRVDGRLKVTGVARYYRQIFRLERIVQARRGHCPYSTIANGRTVSGSSTAAARETHRACSRRAHPQKHAAHEPDALEPPAPAGANLPAASGRPDSLLGPARLRSWSAATHRPGTTFAGTLIKVEYEARPPVVFDPRTAKEDAIEPPQRMWPLSSSIGDANKAIAGAAVKIEQTYTMPDRHHNPMEPHASLAVWDDNGTLTLYDSTQMVVGTRKLVTKARALALPTRKSTSSARIPRR